MWKMSILERAIKMWGIDAQLDMLIEEMSEIRWGVRYDPYERIRKAQAIGREIG